MVDVNSEEVPRVARRQGGVFTAEQAVVEGWTVRQIRRRLARGRWQRLAGGVLADAQAPPSALGQAWLVALLWPDGVCVLRTAAALWRLPVPGDGLIHVSGPAGRRAKGVRVHVLPVSDEDVEIHGRIRVTSRYRTLLDCLAGLEFGEALDLYAWATTRDLLARSDVTAEFRERLGRPGAGQLRRLLAVTRTGAVSSAEHRLHGLLSDAGLGGWQSGVRIVDGAGVIGVVDVLFPREKLVIEVDGERAHSGREAFVRDRRRQNRLVNAGYRVLRFTWWDLTEQPDRVVEEIRRARDA